MSAKEAENSCNRSCANGIAKNKVRENNGGSQQVIVSETHQLSSYQVACFRRSVNSAVRHFVHYNQLISRAAFQVLIIPYRVDADGQPRYLLFKRTDLDVWQWIAGGGENQESPEQAARREAFEEAGIPETAHLIRLDSVASIPAIHFADRHLWGNDVYVIREYSFAVEVKDEEVCLSGEHKECVWLNYETARSYLEWDSNKTALWELHSRLLSKHA